MQIWIDIENASGTRYGNGPITTATSWTSTRPLDRVGTFSFTMPAADPMAAHVKNKRYVRCWRAGDDPTNLLDRLQEVGAGIIESISLRPVDGASMLVVEGVDLLSELANVTVGDLGLYLDDVQTPEVKHQLPSTSVPWAPGGTINLQPLPDLSYIFVKNPEIFWRVSFTISSPHNSMTAELEAQYFSVNITPHGWDGVVLTDGTSVGGKTLAQTGNVDFDPSLGWDNLTYGGYDLRLYNQSVDLGAVKFDAITVTVRKPTMTALQDAMALAPDGWTLDPAGKLETEAHLAVVDRKGVYLQMAGESLLATLETIAQQTGEHFILSPVGRRVLWLGKDETDSGLRAIGPVDPGASPDDFTLYLREGGLQRTQGSYELVTRLYAYGGGIGDERITLADATDSAPAGYTLDGAGSWLQNTAAAAEYGRIDGRGDYPDIVALDTSTASQEYAGNMLLQRAHEDLSRRCQLQEAYETAVVPARYPVWPGQTIRVIYDEWVEGFHSIAIDAVLRVLDVQTTITANDAIPALSLTVATVDTFPVVDSTRIATSITTSLTGRAQKIPGMELSKGFAGEVVGMRVVKGRVVSVTAQPAVTPFPDGKYPPDEYVEELIWIDIKNGKIVNVGLREIGP